MINENQTIKVSPHGSFRISQICKTLAICEADTGDRYGWGNAEGSEPAFIAYLGCAKDEVAEKIRWINQTTGCYLCEVRKAKYLNTEMEIKIRDLKRYNDEDFYGLEYIAWVENGYDPIGYDPYGLLEEKPVYGLKTETTDYDTYNYHTGGHWVRW